MCREKSTLTVLTHVFLALAPTRNPPKSAPQSAAVGVGVLLEQCLIRRLLRVPTRQTAPKVQSDCSMTTVYSCTGAPIKGPNAECSV